MIDLTRYRVKRLVEAATGGGAGGGLVDPDAASEVSASVKLRKIETSKIEAVEREKDAK